MDVNAVRAKLARYLWPVIRRDEFRGLPREVVLKYAEYHGIPNPRRLSSSQICEVLYNDRSELLELGSHIHYFRQILAWLLDHSTCSSSSIAIHRNIKTQIWDVLTELLHGLAGAGVADLITEFATSLARIHAKPPTPTTSPRHEYEETDEASDDGTELLESEWHSDLGSEFERTFNFIFWGNYVCNSSDDSDSSYASSSGTSDDDDAHMTQEEICEAEEYGVASELVSWLEEQDIGSRKGSLKRALEDNGEEVASVRKRARIWDSDIGSDDESTPEQVLWAHYVCDDSDSSYSPSTATSENDDAHMNLEEVLDAQEYCILKNLHPFYKRFRGYKDEDGDVSGDLSSDSEHDGGLSSAVSKSQTLWKDYPSESSDTEDSDYVPAAWNFEDILDIVPNPVVQSGALDDNEKIEFGYLSDAGLSDGSLCDSNGGHFRHSWTLERKISIPDHLKGYSSLPIPRVVRGQIPPHLLVDPKDWYGDEGWPSDSGEFLVMKCRPLPRQQEAVRRENKLRAGIKAILQSSQLHYAFDDQEWKAFEDLTLSLKPNLSLL